MRRALRRPFFFAHLGEKGMHPYPIRVTVQRFSKSSQSRVWRQWPRRGKGSILTHLFPLASALCLRPCNMLIFLDFMKHHPQAAPSLCPWMYPPVPSVLPPALAIPDIRFEFLSFLRWLGFCSIGVGLSKASLRPWNVRREKGKERYHPRL